MYVLRLHLLERTLSTADFFSFGCSFPFAMVKISPSLSSKISHYAFKRCRFAESVDEVGLRVPGGVELSQGLRRLRRQSENDGCVGGVERKSKWRRKAHVPGRGPGRCQARFAEALGGFT